MPIPYPASIGFLLAAAFLLAGLLTGVWKYTAMRQDESARAPVYVDIAHRASLLYAFSMGLMSLMTLRTSLSASLQIGLLVALALSFGFAVSSYVAHGILRDTDNQFRKPHMLGKHELHGAVADWIMALKGGIELIAVGWLTFGFWQMLPA